MPVFSLIERLTPHIEREVNLIINSNQEAETLKSKLTKIQEGLQDAERQGVTDLNIRSWLRDLEDVMYQMDDVLDEWETMNLKLQIEQSHDRHASTSDSWEKVRSVLLFLSLCPCFKHLVGQRSIILEMKALSRKLDSILEDRGRYSFVSNSSSSSQEFRPEESTSFVDKSEVYGRDSEMESLVEMLLSSGERNGIQVISVVGIGGVGKTTLAQLVYNDRRVKDHFDLKAWVSVPDLFDASKIAKATLENVRPGSSGSSMLEALGQEDGRTSLRGFSMVETLGQEDVRTGLRGSSKLGSDIEQEDVWTGSSGSSMVETWGQNEVLYGSIGASALETLGQNNVGNCLNGASTMEALGQRIKAVVSKKSFLLVLDNVRTDDCNKWESLKNCLVGALECRILVTTRSEVAARMMGTSHWQRLSLLSDNDCGRILHRIALDGRSKGEHEKFRDIGSEIAKKCNGLPLAARAVGSMLALRFTVQEWQDILESPLWKYEEEMGDIFRLLRLSYIDLSPVLKRCFLSCVFYSKGSQLHVADLNRVWMAQGYISSGATADQVQLRGLQYLQKLSMRSFFQELERYEHVEGNLSCKMHDIMHDFARYMSRSEYYFILDGRTVQLHNLSNYQSPHYLPLDSMGRMRTFCVRYVPIEALHSNLFGLLKCVRVLCLSSCGLEVLPQNVGKLIHLRYLDLSWNPLKELPETVTDLCNLQTLDLRRCEHLSRLPHGIKKLMKLRHLIVSGTHNLTQFPPGLENLTGLWTLDEFRATRDSVRYLRNLDQLQGSLSIKFESLDDPAEAAEANLRNKNHIQALELIFLKDVTIDVVEAMVPPPRLQTLKFVWASDQLPSWITTSLNNLKHLTINSISSHSPPLGTLPMLETLHMSDLGFTSLTLEFLGIEEGTHVGGFPKLRELGFAYCERWEEWLDVEEAKADTDSVSIMPCLQNLVLIECPRLKALPHNLLRLAKSLQELLIDDESKLLASRYNEETGADWDKISHIPNILIFATSQSEEMDAA